MEEGYMYDMYYYVNCINALLFTCYIIITQLKMSFCTRSMFIERERERERER